MSECNCKNKKIAKTAQKYSDDDTMVRMRGIAKVIHVFKIVLIFVLVFSLFIIVTPFTLIYIIISKCKRKKIKINVSKLIRVFYVKTQ